MAQPGDAVVRTGADDLGIPSLASMLEQLDLEEPRHPLTEQVELDGRNYRVDGLRRLFRAHRRKITERGSTLEVACVLVPAAWDADRGNSVAVAVASQHVGYLPAELAEDYSRCLTILAGKGFLATGVAQIWARETAGRVTARVTVSLPMCSVFE